MSGNPERPQDVSQSAIPKLLTPAARRALEEAEQRRRERDQQTTRPPEHGGPRGPEPTRYGDWEIGGIASDF